MGLGPETLCYKEIESSQSIMDLPSGVGLFLFQTQLSSPLFCLSMHIIGYLAKLTTPSVPMGRAQGPSSVAQSDVYRLVALYGMP
jgi:hypothetical protein